MERETLHTEHHRQAIVDPTPPPPQPDPLLNLSKPGWLFQLAATQVVLLSTTFLSPLSALLSDAPGVPLSLGIAIRRVALGLLYAACICFTLFTALVVAILIGVALVRFWLEEPVSLRSKMHFDYTHPRPFAAVSVGDGFKGRGIPAGHATRVWLELVMPESDYNSRVAIFQENLLNFHQERGKQESSEGPGIEQKVLDATSNEPWGPHGSLLADIAHATRNY